MQYATLHLEDIFTMILFFFGVMVVFYAQSKVSRVYKYSKNITCKKKLSGVEVARQILDQNGLSSIYVVETKGELTDHYDPNRKVIRLSSSVFHGESIASIAVAAHECGHAIQDKEGYLYMRIRSMLVPTVNFITYIGYFVSIIALFSGMMGYLKVGIFMVLATILFQLVTLPVEFDASKRAEEALSLLQVVDPKERGAVHEMLSAAAFTYVASFLSSIIQLFRLILMYNNNKDD